MKVCVYLHSYPPFRYTGGEMMTADLLESLAAKGHDVTIFAATIDKPYERNGVRIVSSAGLHKAFIEHHDIFITHPEIRTGAIRHTKHMPYVGIVHNTNSNTLRSLDRQAPDLTIVNSEYTRDHVPSVAQRSGMGVVVLHPPVLIRPTVGVQAGGNGASPSTLPARRHVTMVNLSHEKGAGVLRYVAASNPDMSFLGVIGGHGVQQMGYSSNVTLLKPQSDMRPVYEATKVLIFPTKNEAYGKVAAEATQFGIPLIVSDLPALHEVCGDAAMYVDPSNYAAWDVALQVMQFDVLDKYAALSAERGAFLHERSLADLDRFEAMLLELAGR